MKNAQTISINGLEVSGDLATLRALLGIAEMAQVSAQTALPEEPKPAPKEAPKEQKAAPKRKSRKQKPQPEVKTSKSDKAYHKPDKHTLTDHQVKRLDGAVLKLWEAGFEKAEWRVEGTWAWIYPFEEKVGYGPAFQKAAEKAFKGSKWAYSKKRGAVVYKDFLR